MQTLSYNSGEILQTAIQIENNASRYYRRAHELAHLQGEHKDLFLYLSRMEEEHAVTFKEMYESLSQQEREHHVYDPGNEMLYYLEGMAGLSGWEGKAGPNANLTGHESYRDVLTIAINAERDTINFYNYLIDFVPQQKGRSNVERIIKEEMRHVAILNRELDIIVNGKQT